MAITIHYNGTLRRDASLSDLINDVHKEIFKTPGWGAHVFRDSFEDTETDDVAIFGMIFFAPKSDPVFLTFDNARNLSMWLITHHDVQEPLEQSEISAPPVSLGAFTKTQGAGLETHMRIVDLLRMLSQKYFDHFEMVDEAGYWENRDVEMLRDRFGKEDGIVATLEKKLKAL